MVIFFIIEKELHSVSNRKKTGIKTISPHTKAASCVFFFSVLFLKMSMCHHCLHSCFLADRIVFLWLLSLVLLYRNEGTTKTKQKKDPIFNVWTNRILHLYFKKLRPGRGSGSGSIHEEASCHDARRATVRLIPLSRMQESSGSDSRSSSSDF